ncbi:Pimeloyl-ACP methyl ester carboxylesterase [Vreelandella subterranea]|uniref:Pimeloyl-ACP methyl ester carboxylesterase n=1 Tax=Vreelandella subterranea TaxID=416874 RepID=A0A1H9W904_9GAMM|nr:alpha/beta hydrolase [Halomonas subterranea]SES30271.1 Pimeloyl-ACP methyl ester carboxylesterase [Halomonas subterranea]
MPADTSSRPRLVFAHANGFPGLSYRSLLDPLAESFDLHPLDRLGHHPDYPVNHNWGNLVDELLSYLPDSDTPLLGVGHSLGGTLMAMAADKQPERFCGVIMLDPPLMLGRDAWAMKAAKRFGFVDRVTPAGKTLGRRTVWPSREAMANSLRRRGLFRRFTPDALNDYIEAGTRVLADGSAELTFDPRIEVEIFRHLPDHLTRLPRRLSVPVEVVAGEHSDLLTASRIKRLQRFGVAVSRVPGTHMFPMEHPEETRDAILDVWHRLAKTSQSSHTA